VANERENPHSDSSSAEVKSPDALKRPVSPRQVLWWAASVLGVALLLNVGWNLWQKSGTASQQSAASPAAASTASTVEAEKKDEGESESHVEFSAEKLSRADIATAEVQMQAFSQRTEFPGRLTINQDATARIGSIVEGRITRVRVKVGDEVKAGQPVIYIHSHEVADARSQYARSRAAIITAEKSVAQARVELDRARRLLEAKAISQREQQQAEIALTTAQAELSVAKAEQHRTEEFLHHLGVSPEGEDDAQMVSPISGTVIKRDVTPGTVVTPSMDLVTIANLSSIWAIAEVPEKQAAGIRQGQFVTIRVAAFPDASFSARVVYLGETLNTETRTVSVRCLVQNSRRRLRPEMTATIGFSASGAQSVLAVPREALAEVNGEKVVFIGLEKGRFEKRSVEVGREQGEVVEITSGLKAGERVVTRGVFFIKSEFLKGTLSEE
jgi:cobalt-zinc-cadmium efflux system membrane fusion protein